MEIFMPKEKKNLKKPTWNLIFLISILFLQIYQITNRTYFNYQLKKDPVIQLGDSAEDFCFYTTRSIIDGTFSWRMFDEVTFKGLKSDPNFFNFKEDEIVKLVKVNGDQCRVLTTSNGRLKGLLITLNKSINNPLFYKAIQISEEDETSQTL